MGHYHWISLTAAIESNVPTANKQWNEDKQFHHLCQNAGVKTIYRFLPITWCCSLQTSSHACCKFFTAISYKMFIRQQSSAEAEELGGGHYWGQQYSWKCPVLPWISRGQGAPGFFMHSSASGVELCWSNPPPPQCVLYRYPWQFNTANSSPLKKISTTMPTNEC